MQTYPAVQQNKNIREFVESVR